MPYFQRAPGLHTRYDIVPNRPSILASLLLVACSASPRDDAASATSAALGETDKPVVAEGLAGLLPGTNGNSVDAPIQGIDIDATIGSVSVTRLRTSWGALETSADGNEVVFPIRSKIEVDASITALFTNRTTIELDASSIVVKKGEVVINGTDTRLYGFPVRFPIKVSGSMKYIGESLTPTVVGSATNPAGERLLPFDVAVAFQREPARIIVFKAQDGRVLTDTVLVHFAP